MNSVDEQLQNLVKEWSEILQIKGTVRIVLSDCTSGGCDAALFFCCKEDGVLSAEKVW